MNINELKIAFSAGLTKFNINLIMVLKFKFAEVVNTGKYHYSCVGKLAHFYMHSSSNIEFITFFYFHSPTGLLIIGTSH